MLSFSPNHKLENELRILQGKFVETYKSIEDLSPEEAKYLHRFALISNIGASTRIENAILTDQEVEWVDTILQKDGKTTAFDENKIFILDKLKKDRGRRGGWLPPDTFNCLSSSRSAFPLDRGKHSRPAP
jgi:hypothetical protein